MQSTLSLQIEGVKKDQQIFIEKIQLHQQEFVRQLTLLQAEFIKQDTKKHSKTKKRKQIDPSLSPKMRYRRLSSCDLFEIFLL